MVTFLEHWQFMADLTTGLDLKMPMVGMKLPWLFKILFFKYFLQQWENLEILKIRSSRFKNLLYFACSKVSFISKIKRNMLSKIFILKFIILNAESKTIIKANEKNFPSFVSLTDGKEPFNNNFNKPRTPPPLWCQYL